MGDGGRMCRPSLADWQPSDRDIRPRASGSVGSVPEWVRSGRVREREWVIREVSECESPRWAVVPGVAWASARASASDGRPETGVVVRGLLHPPAAVGVRASSASG